MGMGDIATTGMQAAMSDMEIISNNIANANTLGFKRSTANFSDIVSSGSDASGPQIGSGVQLSTVQQNFEQGGFTQTGLPSNLSITGNGFFIMRNMATGMNNYTRSGQFTFDQQKGYFEIGNQRLQGFAAVNGIIPAGSIPTDLQIKTGAQAAKATTTVTAQGLNLNADDVVPTTTPFSATDPTSYNYTTQSTIYDSLGNANTLSMYYVKTAANTWSAYSSVNGSVLNASSPGALTFTQSGQLSSATGLSSLSYTPSNGASAIAFGVQMSGATQFGSPDSTLPFTADGYPAGQFASYSIDNNGVVTANYTNGPSVTVGQVAVANFQSPENLTNLGGATWAATTAAGSPNVSTLNSENNIKQGVLESSNVDLASELVQLISAQNTFQANAQVEQVYNQVMQSVTKL